MRLENLIKNNLIKMSHNLRNNDKYWQTSVGSMLLFKVLKLLLPAYCKGKVLDVEAGQLLYKDLLTRHSFDYESLDFKQTHCDLTFVADIQNMPNIESDRYNLLVIKR